MACASNFVKNIMDNVLKACAPNSRDFLLTNDHYWVNDPCNHELLYLKNQTKKFLFEYEEDYFNKHIATDPTNRYFAKDFSYSLNNNAFRKYNISETRDKLLCYGCSNTFGFGLADDETWPYILSSKFNFEYSPLNFGLIGGSADTISRLVYQTTSTIKPKAVFILFPGMYRKEYIADDNRILNFNVATANGKTHNTDRKTYYDSCKEQYAGYLQLVNPNESFFNFIKNFKFIETMLHGTPLIWGTTCKMLSQNSEILSKYINTSNMIDTSKFNDIPNNYARDGEHYSYNYNEWIADKFYETFKKNNI